jgi:hypothetical protein
MRGLAPEAFFALMDEARKEPIPVAVHLPQEIISAEASDAGVASLEHIETVNESALWRKGSTAKSIGETTESRARRDHGRGIRNRKSRLARCGDGSVRRTKSSQVGERVVSSPMAQIGC